MNVRILFSTNFFKVNPLEVQEFVWQANTDFPKGYFNMTSTPEGFKLSGELHDFEKISLFLQRYVREGHIVRLTEIGYMEGSIESVYSKMHSISNIAINTEEDCDVFDRMEANIFPRRLISQVTIKDSETNQWLEDKKEYIAVAQLRQRRRPYYLVRHESGHQVIWPKEYFDAK